MQTCTAEHRALWLGSWRTRFFTPPPSAACSHVPGPTGPPFSTIQLSCDVKTQTFFERAHVFKHVCWSPTLSLCTRARQHPELFCSAPFCTSIFFPFSTYLFFSFPPFPVGTSMFYVSLKGFGPRLCRRSEEQCSLRGFLMCLSYWFSMCHCFAWSVKT